MGDEYSKAEMLRDLVLLSLHGGAKSVDQICREEGEARRRVPLPSHILLTLGYLVDAGVVRSLPPQGICYGLTDPRYGDRRYVGLVDSVVHGTAEIAAEINSWPEGVRMALRGHPPIILLDDELLLDEDGIGGR